MDIYYYFLIASAFFTHFVADFVFQSHEMSINKSKSIRWLTKHIGVYTIGWIPFTLLFMGLSMNALWFLLLVFATHWITDYFTSKGTSYLWKQERVHDFFVLIGFDQFIHGITLLFLIDQFIPIL